MHKSSMRVAVAIAAAAFFVTACDQSGQLDPTAFRSAALSASNVCADPDVDCAPSGAHAKHGGFTCATCHKVAGRLAFEKGGAAYATGYPAPSYDALTQTCSNVACHRVPQGTFSYYFGVDGNDDPILNTVTYGGGAPRPTPSWYATGATCTGCHDNPPRYGSTGSNVWHSGLHANRPATDPYNQCQFCHPDATGSNGAGTAITNPSLHGNGVVNVQARFTSVCFGCH